VEKKSLRMEDSVTAWVEETSGAAVVVVKTVSSDGVGSKAIVVAVLLSSPNVIPPDGPRVNLGLRVPATFVLCRKFPGFLGAGSPGSCLLLF